MKTKFLLTFLLLGFLNDKLLSQTASVQSFSYTGTVQQFTVPSCVGTISVEAWGAQAGYGTFGSGAAGLGGNGGYATGIMTVTSGQVLYIYVGGAGVNGNAGVGGTGGFNGGGLGGSYANLYSGGGGGGASHIATVTGTLGALASNTSAVLIVAGGGGGGSSYNTAPGGAGGGLTGVNGLQNGSVVGTKSGLGGTQTAGGAGGTDTQAGSAVGSAGTFGNGGNSGVAGCSGGGGGGWYGGGGGSGCNGGGGGGGSSYIAPSLTGSSTTSGVRTGNGLITFSYTFLGAGVLANASSTLICSGTPVTLTASNVSTYTWSPGGSMATIQTVTPTSNTSYTVLGTNTIGCISMAVINVTVNNSQPTLSVVSSTNQVCLGKTVTLTASGAVTYTWNNNVPNGTGFVPSATNSYTVSGQNGCGTSTAVTSVSVGPLPVSIVSNPTIVCAGSTSSIVATAAATSYTWYPLFAGSSNSAIIISPTLSTTYTIAVSDGTCFGGGTIALNALPVPTIAATPVFTTVCAGDIVNFNATGALSYTWNPGNLNGSSMNFTTNAAIPVSVIGTNTFGCKSTVNMAVNIMSSPTLVVTADNNLICAGDPVNITASGASTYSWSNGSNANSISINPTSSTVFTVTGSNPPCKVTQTIGIAVFIPTLSITGNTSICLGETAMLTGNGGGSYLWSNGINTNTIQVTPISTTNFSLTASTTSSGITCPSAASFQVLVLPNPTITASATRLGPICKGESNTLTATGANSYTWDNGSNTAAIVVTPSLVSNIVYTVNGTANNGCTNKTTFLLIVNGCLGIENINSNESGITVYPNPNNGEFSVKSKQRADLKLINELGALVKEIRLDESNAYEQKLSGLSSGIYFVVGMNQDSKYNQKVIITK